MTSNNVIKILVTKTQKERILNYASIKGYKTLSDYIRDLALQRNQFIEDKLKEIIKKIEKIETRIQTRDT